MKWFIRRRCDCDGAICLAWLRHKARSLGRDNMGAIQSILASGGLCAQLVSRVRFVARIVVKCFESSELRDCRDQH